MRLRNNISVYFIELFIMNMYVYFSFNKILNIKTNEYRKLLVIFIFNIILSVLGTYIDFYINSFFNLVIVGFLYGSILGILTKNKIGYSIAITLIAYAICAICSFASIVIVYALYYLIYNKMNFAFRNVMENDYITIIAILLVQFIILYRVFKIKRLKNGFVFLQDKMNNEYIYIIIINISAIVMLIYCLFGTIYDDITKNLFVVLSILAITMVAIIQKTFTMYYKQKLLKDTVKQYEKELQEKDHEIEKLSKEKYEINRINHEFYNRQKALELKVKEFTAESSDELGVLDRIENLSKEYSSSLQEIKNKDKLPLTDIPEIDDMFKYMQSECNKNNIEFKLHIKGEIYHLINEIVPKNKLETLIGDHIRNAIIAINSSKNENKSVLVILGIKEKCYELCIYDSGIQFEIETLKKLGLERATTHKETGGSGIGFMTTFETLKECKASLIIEERHEVKENDYTKAVKIRFDGKNQYKIESYRAEEIQEKCKDKRITINNLKKQL